MDHKGVTRLTGAEHTLTLQSGRNATASAAKRKKSGILKAFSGHGSHFIYAAQAACREPLLLRVCSAPVNLVTPKC
jgi:hypothetical protein